MPPGAPGRHSLLARWGLPVEHPYKNALVRFIDNVEETLIALLLGAMTLITFANVVARYVFNSNILWALEATVFLFAWLVLVGAAYGVKKRAHLGIDSFVNLLTATLRRAVAILAVAICIAFSVLLLIGAWNYWAPFAGLPILDGTLKDQAWYEVNDIPMPDFLRFIEASMNQGEAYEKLPRFIPYAALPLGVALLTLRFLAAALQIFRGRIDSVIAAHEVDVLVGDTTKRTG